MLGKFLMLWAVNFAALIILTDMGKELKEWAEKQEQEEEKQMKKIILETIKKYEKK